MHPRLGCDCDVQLERQIQFTEPRIRINTDALDVESLGWDETRAWDEFARYFQETLAVGTSAPRG